MSVFSSIGNKKSSVLAAIEKLNSIEEPKTFNDLSSEEKQAIIKKQKDYLNNRGDFTLLDKGKLKSVYQSDTKALFGKLNEISPSFCLAKWFNVSIHIPTGRTHSCYHPPSHYIPLEEIKNNPGALHNTEYKKSQRKLMLEGERPKECFFCWNIEDSGEQLSDRAYRSRDVYRPGAFKEVARLGHSGDAKPRYVEVNFNQACNFKCSYCSPHLSTAWHKEIEEKGPMILADGRSHNDITWMQKDNMMPFNGPDNPYLEAFWKWFPEIYPTLHTFRMTGGEPLMDKNTFKVFNYVLNNPINPQLHLSITSNCCPPGNQWKKFLGSLKDLEENNAIDHFMLYCSLDGWGNQAEYIRNGLDFNKLYKNITEYLRNGRKHSLTFIVTFNALSISSWMDYIKNILTLRKEFNTNRQLIWFDVPMLMDPDWLSLKILPTGHLSVLKESIEFMKNNLETPNTMFKGFKDYEIAKVQRLYDWASQSLTNEQALHARANFHAFFKQHDQRRGTDLVKTFPELTDLFDLADQAFKIVNRQNNSD